MQVNCALLINHYCARGKFNAVKAHVLQRLRTNKVGAISVEVSSCCNRADGTQEYGYVLTRLWHGIKQSRLTYFV